MLPQPSVFLMVFTATAGCQHSRDFPQYECDHVKKAFSFQFLMDRFMAMNRIPLKEQKKENNSIFLSHAELGILHTRQLWNVEIHFLLFHLSTVLTLALWQPPRLWHSHTLALSCIVAMDAPPRTSSVCSRFCPLLRSQQWQSSSSSSASSTSSLSLSPDLMSTQSVIRAL